MRDLSEQFGTKHPVAIVTGSGAARVGNAVVRDLAAWGFRVAVHAHTSTDEAQATADELNNAGHEAIVVQGDVSVDEDVKRIFTEIDDQFGRIDVLVNSAAIYNRKRFEDIAHHDVVSHFKANTLGSFLCSQQAAQRMFGQETGGVIINIGDWAIVRPYRDFASYFPSKGAIRTMTRSLAVECSARNPKVRVNAIMPGPVMFPPDMSEQDRQRQIEGTLVKQAGSPEHVAHAVRFLVENDFVTGVCLPIDGGCTIYAGPGTDQHFGEE